MGRGELVHLWCLSEAVLSLLYLLIKLSSEKSLVECQLRPSYRRLHFCTA